MHVQMAAPFDVQQCSSLKARLKELSASKPQLSFNPGFIPMAICSSPRRGWHSDCSPLCLSAANKASTTAADCTQLWPAGLLLLSSHSSYPLYSLSSYNSILATI